jgi:hypothetical protein
MLSICQYCPVRKLNSRRGNYGIASFLTNPTFGQLLPVGEGGIEGRMRGISWETRSLSDIAQFLDVLKANLEISDIVTFESC